MSFVLTALRCLVSVKKQSIRISGALVEDEPVLI